MTRHGLVVVGGVGLGLNHRGTVSFERHGFFMRIDRETDIVVRVSVDRLGFS